MDKSEAARLPHLQQAHSEHAALVHLVRAWHRGSVRLQEGRAPVAAAGPVGPLPEEDRGIRGHAPLAQARAFRWAAAGCSDGEVAGVRQQVQRGQRIDR